MPHFESDGLVLVDFFLYHHKLTSADFVEQPLMNVLLDDALAQFLSHRPQLVVGVTLPGHAHRRLAARVARKRNGDTLPRDADALVAAELIGDDLALFD